jgi:hypothetical protein
MRAEVVSVPNQTPTVLATGERGNVRVYLNQGDVIGGSELLTSSNPSATGYSLPASQQLDFYLEKGEQLCVYRSGYGGPFNLGVLYYTVAK